MTYNPFYHALYDEGAETRFVRDMMGVPVRNDDEAEFFRKSVVAGIPIIGDYLKAKDSLRYAQDYMDNRNLSFGNIKYPYINNLSYGISRDSRSMYGSLNFVSSNIRRLY